ncbi:group III truncated hemoglobin [Bradymonas sediminis]|uniref:Preprotein translocase subunit TatC n=1 Tax=Bradymonas sediminis TaxID=1548548 RepID=A0A2Z4FQY1_9DELT|nr:group III truncated hemoglobin [Bradymonas sediminis]AWV91094.1 preprotein translocase subunit TatC [Bradymonas sediminis]TDP75164.1 hemoglobin [Bradymonas sediminis]
MSFATREHNLQMQGPRPEFSREDIETFVHAFYGRVQEDELIGPVFDLYILDWGPHLKRMVGFWSAVLRGERSYTQSPKGPPPVMHWNMPELEHAHFVRWLDLFKQTLEDVLEPDQAAWLAGRSRFMADALSRNLGPYEGET